MLILILPPIIVVVALVALVYFFSRRFPNVEKEISSHLDNPSVKSAYDTRILDTVKSVSLSVLERLAQWFKVIALRSYNGLHSWTQSLREKKSKVVIKPKTEVSEEIIERKPVAAAVTPKPVMRETETQERLVRPMVSQRVAQPESRVKPPAARPLVRRAPIMTAPPAVPKPAPVKNQLEDILVERIAANPRDLEAYERLGEYYMEQGNLQDAKECYRQVLRLSPVHRLAKVKIRRLEKMLEQK